MSRCRQCLFLGVPSRAFSHRCRGFENRVDDRRVTRTPTDMVGKHLADRLVGRFRRPPQKMGHRTQDSRSAEPALQRMMLREGALHLAERARLGEAFRCHDIRAVGLRSVLRTATHCYSIDQNRTSSAYPMLTADVNPESLELVTQEIAEEHARLSLARSALPIQCYLKRKARTACTVQHCHHTRPLCTLPLPT